MRKLFALLSSISFILIVLVSSLVHQSKAGERPAKNNGSRSGQMPPGTRCTRLVYGPKQKRTKAKESTSATPALTAAPGTRCLRLHESPGEGILLPNKPPNLGLSASTSYLGPEAGAEVRLKAIACDADDDNLLYTYSVSAGRIEGEGAEAVWNLSGTARPGQYFATVEVDDGCGCISFATAEVTVGEK